MDRDRQVGSLPPPACRHVPLPPLDDSIREQTRTSGAIWGDSRRYVRYETDALGKLQLHGTYLSAGRENMTQDVWLRDMSRGGIRFVHGEQLFPGELVSVVLTNGRCLHAEIVWCRCLNDGVFVSGCSLAKAD